MRSRFRSISSPSSSRTALINKMSRLRTVTSIGCRPSSPADNLILRSRRKATATTAIKPIAFRCIVAGAVIAARVPTCKPATAATNPHRAESD